MSPTGEGGAGCSRKRGAARNSEIHIQARRRYTLLEMRWSKVRQLVEESFSESVRGRVTVHITNGDPRGEGWIKCTKSWISVDGVTVAYLDRHGRLLTMRLRDGENRAKTLRRGLVNPFNGESRSPAETDDVMDLSDACWQYLQSKVSESLVSGDPFVQSLAVLSGRVGRQRLRRLEQQTLHPLVSWMLRFRLDAERAQRNERDSSVETVA